MIAQHPSHDATETGGEEEQKKGRVLIVDDHPICRHGLTQLLNSQSDLTVCGEAENPAQALAALRTARADLVLLDISLQGTNGLEFIKQLRAEHPQLPVLVVSMHEESLYALRALRAGAQGYITKREGL